MMTTTHVPVGTVILSLMDFGGHKRLINPIVLGTWEANAEASSRTVPEGQRSRITPWFGVEV
jgi:uncharacterized membrane protein